MKQPFFMGIVLLCSISFTLTADTPKTTCIDKAHTYSQMQACENVSLKTASDALKNLYKQIEQLYKEDKLFLQKLHTSQKAWQKLLDANMQMRFPKSNKKYEYGSAFTMCNAEIQKSMIYQRILFLQQWLDGIAEGDVCVGSIKRPNELNKGNQQ